MLVETLIILTVALLIAYAVLYTTSDTASYQGESAYYDLNQSSKVLVLENKYLPWTNTPCALRFGIFVEQAPKTVSKVDCVSFAPDAIVSSFAPSCSDYDYKTCECAGTDCGRCAMDDSSASYMSKLLNIGDNLELWASGYTSQNDKPYIPALLKLRTAKDGSNHYMESVSLPAIPLQKWTIITIVKEGRRIDVFYGSKVVSSKMLKYIPVPPDGSRHWYAGNARWKGKIGFFNPTLGSVSEVDVEKDVGSLVNTRGVPFYLEKMKFDFQVPEMSTCLFGNCNKLPDIVPQNPFTQFSSSFS